MRFWVSRRANDHDTLVIMFYFVGVLAMSVAVVLLVILLVVLAIADAIITGGTE